MAARKGTLESLGLMHFWRNKRVLVTGHTGFKGSWLCELLIRKGADVYGLALEPEPETKCLFEQLNLRGRINHSIVDLRDILAVEQRVGECQPDIVFHLAAQSIVTKSYKFPVETWMSNLMGSVHLMKALSNLRREVSLLITTTDKVYENRSDGTSFTELDRLGGYDPYSASKAAVELAAISWRNSYNNLRICTARAGNVIGGGDWAVNRLLPDLARALSGGYPLIIRNPNYTRPFQHVLDPLRGYLMLAEKLSTGNDCWQSAFNFGPADKHSYCVRQIVEKAFETWPGEWKKDSGKNFGHEAEFLNLDCSKSNSKLKWFPRWGIDRSLSETVGWYKAFNEGVEPQLLVDKQIADYECSE